MLVNDNELKIKAPFRHIPFFQLWSAECLCHIHLKNVCHSVIHKRVIYRNQIKVAVSPFRPALQRSPVWSHYKSST